MRVTPRRAILTAVGAVLLACSWTRAEERTRRAELGSTRPHTVARAVGLEARGVDPRAALENPLGLDVRDELGRPVSARKVGSELKKAQAAAASETSYVSLLPQAKAAAVWLELWFGHSASLGARWNWPDPRRAWAVVCPSPNLGKVHWRPLLAAFFILLLACRRSSLGSSAFLGRSALSLPLRC